MRLAFITALVCITPLVGECQKVGLVLSGGAAKGIAHVGVLKALEENEIPIDNVVGTSMGGIIAGCYAAGMSPDQIEAIVLSEEFLRWVNGQPEPGYNYFYHKGDQNPGFLKVNLSLDSIFNFQFNTSIASDVSLNFTLAEKMSLASAISGNNFDSLMVPLRVVAADIFTQNQVILSKGLLSDALRATQTVPFFYNPIRVDNKYLFDGGVYNNFPVDVSQNDFKSDIIIGCNVSTKVFEEYPYDQDDKLISNSLLMLLLDKSDPGSVPENGVYIQPNLTGYTSFDFARARSLIDSGYVQTMRQIEEIRRKIGRRATCEQVTDRRNRFNNRNPQMVFGGVQFKGFTSKQKKYLGHIFHFNPQHPRPLHFESIKKSYFRLVSEQYFNNVYPNIYFDTLARQFQFQLTRRPQKNFQVDFGGVIATRDVSNIFVGLNFYNFRKQLIHLYSGFHTGNFYKSAVTRARIDFPFQGYLEPMFAFNSWDFLESDDLINVNSPPTVLKRINRNYGVRAGWPIGNLFRNTVAFEGINNVDDYSNRNIFVSSDRLDELRLTGMKGEIAFASGSLNRKQYASAGKAYEIQLTYFRIREHFEPGSTSVTSDIIDRHHRWYRLRATAEQYFNAGAFRPGYYASAVFSNQPFFRNYRGTIINAPAFFPLQDSRSLLLENFRAFNYIAVGTRNVFSIRNKLDFRFEGYLFKPIEHLQQNADQETQAITDFKMVYVAGTAGLVLHSPIGPISLSLNYYDDKETRLGVMLHAGFLLYNRHPLE